MQTLGEAVVRRHAEVVVGLSLSVRKISINLSPTCFREKNKPEGPNDRNRTRTQGGPLEDGMEKMRGSYMLSTHRRQYTRC